tara:strand:+ start:1057 stop:1203 length:147 start_codon:yes stop_codon:yes gene_type:complete
MEIVNNFSESDLHKPFKVNINLNDVEAEILEKFREDYGYTGTNYIILK